MIKQTIAMKDYSKELEENIREYELVSSMSEEQACEYLNSNSKAEALEAVQCEIDFYKSEVEEYLREIEEENEEPTYGLDPAFGSWSDYYRYMYG